MSRIKADGGNIKPTQAAAKVDIAEKSALVAVPVPKAKAKPDVVKAVDINEALLRLDVSFNVKLNKNDGSTVRETIKIEEMEDFEESILVQKSGIMRIQQRQMAFLHDFQNEIKTNSALREELKSILENEKKEDFIRYLKGWIKQFDNPESPLFK